MRFLQHRPASIYAGSKIAGEYLAAGVPEALARHVALSEPMVAVLQLKTGTIETRSLKGPLN